MTQQEQILKWEENWDNYCAKHQTGADEDNMVMFLGVERGFGKDFIRELLASQKQQILEAVWNIKIYEDESPNYIRQEIAELIESL